MNFFDLESLAAHDQRLLCSGCNMFGSVEDVPWSFNGMSGTAGGMTEINGKWYHRPQCSTEVLATIQAKRNIVIEQQKKSFPALKLVPREERRKQVLSIDGAERRVA